MAAGDIARVMRAPGRIVINPDEAFATNSFPYGGTEVGKTNRCVLMDASEEPFEVEGEGLGDVTDLLEPTKRYLFTCFMRGWDDDAVELLLSQGFTAGATTQHSVFTEPAVTAGASTITGATSRSVVLAYVPDDLLHSSALLIMRGVVYWTPGAEMAFQRGDELGIPLTVRCVQNGSGVSVKVGRLPDLTL